MNKIFTVFLLMTMLAPMARAEFKEVKNQTEIENIKRAVQGALPSSDEFRCYDQINKNTVHPEYNAQLLALLEMDQVNFVYRDLAAQPVLLLKEMRGKADGWSPYTRSFYFWTDVSGTKITRMDVQMTQLKGEGIANVGTIANPRYENVSGKWVVVVSETCTVTVK